MAGLDPKKNVGFVNENVSPQSMFSYGALKDTNPRTKNVTEDCYHFDENLFNNFEDGTNLDGYLQTERYFKHIQQEIRSDFAFKDEILEPCNEFISSFENILFLHVRRGDNVGREDYYRMMTFDYYKREHWNTLMRTHMSLSVLMILSGVQNKSSLMMKGS